MPSFADPDSRRNRAVFLRAAVSVAAVVAASLTIVAGALATRWLSATRDASRRVQHTYQVIAALDGVRAAVTDVETAQRGYVLARDARFLAPYGRRTDARAAYARARRLTVDDPAQQRRLDTLGIAMEAKLAFAEAAVRMVSTGRPDSALTLVRAGTGLVAMQRLQAVVRRAVAAEEALLAQRIAARDADLATARRTVLLSLLAAGVAAVLALAALRREAVRLARAHRDGEDAERRAIVSEEEAWDAERHARDSEARAREREAQYRLLFDANPVPAWVHDQETLRFLAVNPAACRHYGYTAQEFAAMTLADLQPGDDRAEVETWVRETLGRAGAEGERVQRAKDGRLMTVALSSHALRYDGRPARLVLAHDLTELRRAEAALGELVVRDELTGLLNRRGFRALAEQELKVARRAGRVDAVLYLDLDDFKVVNDTYGHAEGDAALRAVAGVLRNAVREGDIVARLGGDEFAIYAPGLARRGEGRVVAGRIAGALAAHSLSAQAAGRPYRLAACIGVAEPEPGEDLDEFIARADAALYARKAARKRVA